MLRIFEAPGELGYRGGYDAVRRYALTWLYADFSDHDREHRPAGFGLGLVICKGLVEAHGGRIRAESAGPGLGTRFTFTLPVAGEAGRGAAAGSSASGPAPSGERREAPPVLVVDDDPETLRYVRDETVARALEAGAADYIVKPFSPTEFAARVGAALRRRAGAEPFVLGDLAIDYEQRLVTVAGNRVRLTAKEYELLRVLSMNAGRVVTYAALLRRVWENGGNGAVEPVRDFVKKLRRQPALYRQ